MCNLPNQGVLRTFLPGKMCVFEHDVANASKTKRDRSYGRGGGRSRNPDRHRFSRRVGRFSRKEGPRRQSAFRFVYHAYAVVRAYVYVHSRVVHTSFADATGAREHALYRRELLAFADLRRTRLRTRVHRGISHLSCRIRPDAHRNSPLRRPGRRDPATSPSKCHFPGSRAHRITHLHSSGSIFTDETIPRRRQRHLTCGCAKRATTASFLLAFVTDKTLLRFSRATLGAGKCKSAREG